MHGVRGRRLLGGPPLRAALTPAHNGCTPLVARSEYVAFVNVSVFKAGGGLQVPLRALLG